jgi:hypothetical protein
LSALSKRYFHLYAIPSHTLDETLGSILQILFAMSPLLALAYVLFSAFEDPKSEALKRRKKGDFELEGHGD